MRGGGKDRDAFSRGGTDALPRNPFQRPVRDITAPSISCPANVTINCQDSQVPANTGQATATDNCDASVTITYSDATVAGSCPDSYTVNRSWTATDNCGNTTTKSQTLTVQDSTAPALTIPPNVNVECDALPAPGTATATDNATPT